MRPMRTVRGWQCVEDSVIGERRIGADNQLAIATGLLVDGLAECKDALGAFAADGGSG